MKELELRQKSIQRWENEGGALLPRDCNVHYWKHRIRGSEIHYDVRYGSDRPDPQGEPAFHQQR